MNENENATKETLVEKPQTDSNQFRYRLISMLVLATCTAIAGSVLTLLIIGQILFRSLVKELNDPIKLLANQLTDYIYNTLSYLSFNSEERPFPYQIWDENEENSKLNSETVDQTA